MLVAGCVMAIYRLLQKQVFDPDDVRLMCAVYEDVLKGYGLIERTDPLTELIAKTVIEMVQSGERDPARLKDLTVKAVEEIKR
jgi:type II secretory pathway component PulF